MELGATAPLDLVGESPGGPRKQKPLYFRGKKAMHWNHGLGEISYSRCWAPTPGMGLVMS